MSQAVIIPNTLPPQLEALSAVLATKRDELAKAADAIKISDVESLAVAEALFVDVDRFIKDTKEGRLAVTRQIDDLKAQIMQAETDAISSLITRKTDLARAIDAFRQEQARIQREAEEKARKEAEEQARKLREDAEALAAKQREEREAERKRREEEAALFGAAESEPEPEPEPMPVVVPAATLTVPASAPALPKSAVRKQVRKELQITDENAIIEAACKDNGKLYGRAVLVVDVKAIDALVRAGCAVPGAKMNEREVFGSSGRR